MADVDQMFRDAVAYVENIDDDCIYLDGYVCQPDGPRLGESSKVFAHVVDDSGTLPAPLINTWIVAYTQFMSEQDLTDQQKQLKHYRIGFAIEKGEAIVLFRPLLLPHIVNGKPGGIMRATIGKEVTIKVNLKTQNVTQVLYGK